MSADTIVPGADALTIWPSDTTATGAWRTGGGGPANPQELNRYTYVTNNPVTSTDPTGHFACGGGPCMERAAGRGLGGGGLGGGGGSRLPPPQWAQPVNNSWQMPPASPVTAAGQGVSKMVTGVAVNTILGATASGVKAALDKKPLIEIGKAISQGAAVSATPLIGAAPLAAMGRSEVALTIAGVTTEVMSAASMATANKENAVAAGTGSLVSNVLTEAGKAALGPTGGIAVTGISAIAQAGGIAVGAITEHLQR